MHLDEASSMVRCNNQEESKHVEDFKQVKSNELFDVASLAAGTYVLRAHDLNGLELSHHLLIKL